MKQFFLIAVQISGDNDLEDDIQGALESLADMSVSDVHPIPETDVPASAHRIY